MKWRRMRGVLAASLVSAPLLLLGADWPAVPVPLVDALQLGRPASRIEAPAFELTTLDGRHIRLDELRGRAVLLYFWATW
jgi:cytochrome oxidase Cu insertion factor (SCO1/SenC/PrrC family)